MKKIFNILISFVLVAALALPLGGVYTAYGEPVEEPTTPEEPVTPSEPSTPEPSTPSTPSDSRESDSGESDSPSTITTPREEEVQPQVDMTDKVSLVFTADIHSHLASVNDRGGLAKVKTRIDNIEERYGESFILDGGGFSVGTPFQTIFTSHAAELRAMGEVGYDVTTLGDSEFKYGAAALASMLRVAAENNETTETTERVYDEESGSSEEETVSEGILPEIVCANIDFDATLNDDDMKKDGNKLRRAFAQFGVNSYTVIEKQDMTVAVFGLMGPDDIEKGYAGDEVQWEDYIDAAKETVENIEEKEKPDFIVCLSRGGLDADDPTDGNDVDLAKKVDGIDVILSASESTVTEEPVEENGTQIISLGTDCENVGHIVLEKDGDGATLDRFRVMSTGRNVAEDSGVASEVSSFVSSVNSAYFSDYGYSYGDSLTDNEYEFADVEDLAAEQREEPLCNLISDSFIYGVRQAEGGRYEEVTAAVTAAGSINETLYRGDITVAEVFETLSSGEGKNGMDGDPIISFYLTGKELKSLAEIDATVSEGYNDARLYISGMSYGINRHRLYLNRAVDIQLQDDEGNRRDVDSDKLYRVVAGLSTCRILDRANEESNGLASVTPKDRDGEIIGNYEEHAVEEGGDRLMTWSAAAQYMDSFDGEIPSYYDQTHERKINADSWNPWELIKQPNSFGMMVTAVILIPVVIIVGLIVFLRRRRIRNRGYGRRMFGKSYGSRRPAYGKRRTGNNKFDWRRRRISRRINGDTFTDRMRRKFRRRRY